MSSQHMVVIGDCRRMNEIKSSSVQLIITSPPPFFYKCTVSNSGQPQDFNSYAAELKNVFSECNRVLETGRYLCINIRTMTGKDSPFPIPGQLLLTLKLTGFEYRDDVIWQKRTVKPNGKQTSLFSTLPVEESFVEHTLIFCKGKPGKNGRVLEKKLKAWMKAEDALICWDTGLWGIKYGITGELADTHEFSEQMTEALISMYTYEGEAVLDPFLGDGTVSRAAALLNRRSIGYESNPFNLRIIRRKSGIPENCLKVVFQGEGRLT